MDKISVSRPERESYVKHRRDVTRQIILPLVFVIILAGVAAVLAGLGATGNGEGVSLWADISLIWLIIPMMIFAIVILALTLAVVYGLNRLLKVSPRYTGIAQAYALWLSAEVVIWTDRIIRPVVVTRSWLDLLFKKEE
jgi:uncharacterized BrkB/YihY/UPF0761 family membrane protein